MPTDSARPAWLVIAAIAVACDQQPTASATDAAPAPVATDAAPASRGWDAASMPPRPVPRSSPTVSAGMPAEVQMQAIAYMNAMQEPHPGDPVVDSAFVKGAAEQLRASVVAIDKGSAEAKLKLGGGIETIAGGRRVDLMLAQGCDQDMPKRALQRAGLSLETMFIHGVLLVKCNDSRAQCLQSTRDGDDVLCTTAPRHR